MKQMALSGSVASPRRFDPERDGFWDGYRYEIDPRFPKVLHVVERHRAALV
jgi:1-acyl-sn-glycerol-3-phosphate acyltransferase